MCVYFLSALFLSNVMLQKYFKTIVSCRGRCICSKLIFASSVWCFGRTRYVGCDPVLRLPSESPNMLTPVRFPLPLFLSFHRPCGTSAFPASTKTFRRLYFVSHFPLSLKFHLHLTAFCFCLLIFQNFGRSLYFCLCL